MARLRIDVQLACIADLILIKKQKKSSKKFEAVELPHAESLIYVVNTVLPDLPHCSILAIDRSWPGRTF